MWEISFILTWDEVRQEGLRAREVRLGVIYNDEGRAGSPEKEVLVRRITRALPTHWFVLCVLPAVLINVSFIAGIVQTAISDDRFTQVLAMPLVALYTLWQDAEDGYRRKEGKRHLALVCAWVGMSSGLWSDGFYDGSGSVFLRACALLVGMMCGFMWLYGWEHFLERRFVFLLLALAMPPSEAFLVAFEEWLQRWSANVTQVFFEVVRLSYIRSELMFSLPGIDIVVARECSGVRSAIAIFVAVVSASRFLAASVWGRILLCATAIPLAVVKNGLRITLLGALAVWVSPEVFQGPMHRYGGMIFSVIALLLYIPVIIVVRRIERRNGAQSQADVGLAIVLWRSVVRALSKSSADRT